MARWNRALASSLVVVGTLAALACAPGEESTAPPAAASIDLAASTVVDLTHAFDSETVYWPTSPTRFELDVLSEGVTEGGWFYSAKAYASPEHGGTHLDAPIHFAAGRHTVEQIPVSRLIAPAVVLDVRQEAARDPDYALDLPVLDAWEAAHGKVPPRSVVLLWTGWDEKWPDAALYLGDDTPGDASNLHFPSFGLAAVRRLIEERGVAALGVDTASIDPGAAHDFPVHRLASDANVPGFENVTGLGAVPATGAWVVALPMKIRGGTGAPLRIVALVPPGVGPSGGS